MAVGKYHEWLTEDKQLLLQAWARDGLTDEQIAKNMGISPTTLYEWKKKYPQIAESLKKGKEVADIVVENALYKKCMGYNATIKKTFKVKNVQYNEDGRRVSETEELVEAFDEVHIPADTTAQIFWLKNRKPDQWRDKREEKVELDASGFAVNIQVVD